MAEQVCMITIHSMKPIQCTGIHVLPCKYNVPLRT